MPTAEKRTIAIIGAGFSGTLTAINILRANPPDNLRVVLIEKEQAPGRGLAYRFGDDNLLLNVPAGNMSALADEPDHFVHYCQDVDPAFNAKSFISRRLYGEYLEYALAQAERTCLGILERMKDEAVAVLPDTSRNTFRIELANGSSIEATQVVLALGHLPPQPPASIPEHLHRSLINLWDFNTLDRLDPNKPVLILGMGHTAIDALFRLTSCNNTRKIILLSRRGLLPHAHRFNPNPPNASDYPDYLVGLPLTIRAYTHALRREVDRREATGGNWRDVINELRPHTPHLWQGLSDTEKRRFLKKIVPYWDIHRHRLAPSAARRLENLLASGQVERLAGHIIGFDTKGTILNIQIKERGNGQLRNLEISAIVNCTGPNYDLAVDSQPLLTQLRKAGLIQQDPLKLGLLVDDNYRVIDVDNQPVEGLFYVGPMLKAKYWEAIAIPELRIHARRLARHLLSIEH